MRKITLVVLGILLISSFCFAETIILKSGTKIEGKIVERTDEYIKVDSGIGMPLTYFFDMIESIDGQNVGLPSVKKERTISAKETGVDYSKEAAESIKDILSRAKDIGPVQYEIVGTTIHNFGEEVPKEVPRTIISTMKVWQKLPYMKFESIAPGISIKMIVHPDTVYFYDAQKDEYFKMTLEKMAGLFTYKTPGELSKEIEKSTTLKVLGTETIDGKLTTLIETSQASGGVSIIQKLWIWNEKGMPIRQESTMGNIATKIEYKNFIFGDIADSVFEVPADKIANLKLK